MKVGEILREKQNDVYKELNSKPIKRKKKRRGRKKKKQESLSFSDVEKMMRHDSHTRSRGGAIRQKSWGE